MGAFCMSMHFKTTDADRVRAAAGQVARAAGGRMFVAPAARGWVAAYPSEDLADPDLAQEIAAAADAPHALMFLVHDSDVFYYWYCRDGEFADHFNSCPDYFGDAEDEDDDPAMAATGDPEAFAGLLDKPGRAKLRDLTAVRMIEGEFVGEGREFDAEEDRLLEIASLLGIAGAMGLYELIAAGEAIEGVAAREAMVEVG